MAFTGLKQDLESILGTTATNFNDELTLDVTVAERPTYKATPTKKRVESGSDTTDNVRIEPIELGLTLILTDDILVGLSGQTANEKASIFEGYWREGRRNTITTAYRRYTSMVITSFVLDRNKDTANAAFIAMTAVEVRVVSTALLDAPAADVADTVAGTSDQGAKPTISAEPQDESLLTFLFGSLFGG